MSAGVGSMQDRTALPPRSRSNGLWWLGPAVLLLGGVIFAVEVGGPIAAIVGGAAIPDLLSAGEVGAVVKGLFRTAGDPGKAWAPALDASPTAVWAGLAIATLIYGVLAYLVSNAIDDWKADRRAERRGFAGQRELTRNKLTEGQAVAQAKRTTARLADLPRRDIDPYVETVHVGRNVASSRRQKVNIQHRDGVLVFGPTGSGKTWRLATQRVWDAPGFVLATTTRADLLAATVEDRLQRGRVEVYDPENITGWPHKLRWSLLAGCEDPDTAIRRAKALVQAMPMGDTKNASYWDGKATTLMRSYLHAAALDNQPLAKVKLWTSQRKNSAVLSILREHGREDWAAELDQILSSRSDSTDDMIGSAARLLEPLASPALMASMETTAAESVDLRELIFEGNNTLYLHSTYGEENSSAAFTSVLAAEIYHLAHKESQRRHETAGRLDPYVRLVLDECNNVAPIPSLPHRITDSGGRGISIWAFVHNQLQNEARWGREAGKMFSTNSPVRIVLPGLGDPDELESLARLTGKHREWITEGASRHSTLQTEETMSASAIREMEQDHALMIYRGAKPIMLHLPTVWDFKQSKARVESSMRLFSQIVSTGEIVKVPAAERQGFTSWTGRR